MFIQWGEKLVLIVLVIFGGRLALRLSHALIEKSIDASDDGPVPLMSEQRADTLQGLLCSVASYLINFIVILTVLQLLGIPIQTVLAGAGIAGLAVGFGAQNLIRDVITGFFILYEDHFGVGDAVTLAGVTGTVEEMGLRVTKIRDFDGSLHIVPNGDIGQVNNQSRGTSRVVVNVDVAYEEDVEEALRLLEELCEQFEDQVIVDGPRVLGVQELGASAVTIGLFVRTEAREHFDIGRRLRLEAKKTLDDAGIEIPYERLVLVPPDATKIGRSFAPLSPTGGEVAREQELTEDDSG
jgi:small conductance mechanosensitive channel